MFWALAYVLLAAGTVTAETGDLWESVRPAIGNIVALMENSGDADVRKPEQLHRHIQKAVCWDNMAQRILSGSRPAFSSTGRDEAVQLLSCFLQSVFVYRSTALLELLDWFYHADPALLQVCTTGPYAAIFDETSGGCLRGLKFVRKNNRWVLYDFTAYGSWMIRNYRAQCREILRNRSTAALLDMLRTRIAQTASQQPCNVVDAGTKGSDHSCSPLTSESILLLAGVPFCLFLAR